jgi:hypothetical protein
VSSAKSLQDALRITKCTWVLKDYLVKNQDTQLVLAGVNIDNITINEDYKEPPTDGYYISYYNNYVWIGENCRTTGTKTFWRSWSPGAGGQLGIAKMRNPKSN